MARVPLATAAWVYIAGLVLHTGDHMRRGLGDTDEGVIWGGTLLLVLAAVALTLVFTRHALAPAAAVVVGGATAIGVSAAHLLPDWGPLSEELAAADVDALTWLAVGSEIVGGAVLALAGLAIVRRSGYRWLADPGWV